MAKWKSKRLLTERFSGSDLSVIEDSGETGYLIELGKQAGRSAVQENRVLGLANTFVKDGKVFAAKVDGNPVLIAELAPSTKRLNLKKGVVINVRPR